MAFLALVLALAAVEPMGDRLEGDLDGDGQAEVFAFYAANDGMRGFVRHPVATSPVYPAWKAIAGRLAGEEKGVVVLGTWTHKRTRPGEAPRRSVWVVALERGRWVERWRGSMLARPFEDFTLLDLDGDGADELVVRECAGGGEAFTAYRWQGFGFDGIARGIGRRGACRDEIDWRRLRMTGGRLWLGE